MSYHNDVYYQKEVFYINWENTKHIIKAAYEVAHTHKEPRTSPQAKCRQSMNECCVVLVRFLPARPETRRNRKKLIEIWLIISPSIVIHQYHSTQCSSHCLTRALDVNINSAAHGKDKSGRFVTYVWSRKWTPLTVTQRNFNSTQRNFQQRKDECVFWTHKNRTPRC